MTIYYVAQNGIDTNLGTLAFPYKTIQRGLDRIIAGDTLYVRGGVYNEKVIVKHSGTVSSPITVSSYPGETAKIDGAGLAPTLGVYRYLATLVGSYTIFENLELTYPDGSVILISKDANTDQDSSHNILRNLNIHHCWGQGIAVWGSNNLIENNKIWQTTRTNVNHDTPWGGALSFGTSGKPYYGLNTTIRNNEVYQNYGEGILGMYTDNGLIEGNRVWDNWAENIYLDQCNFSTIENNFIFYTGNHDFWRYTISPANGILLSNENNIKTHPIGHDRVISNNIIVDTGTGIGFWKGYAPAAALINDTISKNTIVNFDPGATGINIGVPDNASHQNTIIEDNMIIVPNGTAVINRSQTGITLKNNVEDIDMSVLTDTQALMTEIDTALTGFRAASDAKSAEIAAAQQAKAAVDAQVVTYGQLKSKCQEMVDLLLIKP
jgi:parallel beta-helix repeat protein